MSESDGSDSDFDRAQQRIGQVLRGKYRIDRVLGVGGMAAVYVATHRNQKQFAVKVLHPELSFRDDIRTRFLREGYAANSVKHPGAVAVLDDDVAEDGAAFLVMELLDGLSVEQLSERTGGRLAMAYVLGIAHQLLDTLSAAHAQGIVHRDIKPANLFVTHEGQVKVLDFGIARVRDVASSGAHATGTGMLLGTPGFMAPEQAIGKSNEIDAQTDVWAVGATLFTLLSGLLVHEGETAPHLMILAATTPARSLSALVPEMPPAVVALVDRALAFHKADRWPSSAAMRDAVRDASLALFGRLPLRETLIPIFDDRPDPLAQTRQAAGSLVAPTPGNPPGGAAIPRTTAPVVVAVGGVPDVTRSHAAAASTDANAGFISNEPPISLPAGLPRSNPVVLGIVSVAGLLIVVGGAAVAIRSLAVRAGSADTPSAAEPSALPTQVMSSQAAALAASSPAAAVTLSSSEPQAPEAAKSVDAGPAATSRARPTPASPAVTSVGTPATAGGATPAATPVCRLVSFFDADGNKHFRQECH